jgi:hypothetical protein
MKNIIVSLMFLAVCYAQAPVVRSGSVQLAQSPNSKISAGTGTSIANAWASNTTKGDVILCGGIESAGAIPVFTDNQADVFAVVTSSATAPGFTVAVASNIAGGATTITETTASGSAAFTCYELLNPPPFGQAWDLVSSVQATSATLKFGLTSSTLPGEMLFVFNGMNGGTVNATPGLGGNNAALTTVDQANTTPNGGAALSVFYSAHVTLSSAVAFSQPLSLSASETYSAMIISIKPPALEIASNMIADPCITNIRQAAVINLTGSSQLITGVANEQTYVCFIQFAISNTPDNIALVEGTGTTCASSTVGMAGGNTAATGWNLLGSGSVTAGDITAWAFRTATAGDNVCLLTSSAAQISGVIQYVQQ